MLYYLFTYLEEQFNFPGAGLFQYISFRAAMSILTSLFISLIIGRRIIEYIRRRQIGETVRDLGLEGEGSKKGTPTMGGLIILASILIPVLLFAKLHNTYIIIMILSTIWLGLIGFLDDYIKVFKKNKEGLAGRYKIAGQLTIGIIVGAVIYFSPGVVVKEIYSESELPLPLKAQVDSIKAKMDPNTPIETQVRIQDGELGNNITVLQIDGKPAYAINQKSMKTTLPFTKNHEFNYSRIVEWLGLDGSWGWLIFIPIVIFIVTAVSNGANITDGLDGLAAGTSAIIGVTLGVFAYVSGNAIFADYLNIMYIPNTGELTIFIGAFVGACVGFMWYNSYPAQVFMGDTGSLALGGIIAVFAIAIRKELLIPILCGIFLVENLSVLMQISYFKYTKRRFGEGRRIFKMSPLHHHYQKLGFHESKIVSRFWIVGVALAMLTIITLKIR
jgi:phospho-N-acetylmuramoyl-pentapeptide-transferase